MEPITNPELPYVGEVRLTPGKMLKVQGQVPPDSTRFAINYQLGPGLNPRDDIALHVSPRFDEGFITRNHIQSMTWGPEENSGPMWIERGAPFEIIILCEYPCYKIAVNGRHFAEFAHRFPYQNVTHLVIDGEVEISSIFYETINIPKPSGPIPDPPINVGPPAPGGLYPTLNPQGPPPDAGVPGGPPSFADDFRNNPQDYGYRPKPQNSEEEEDGLFGGFGDKTALAVGGLVAAGGLAAAMHAYNKNKQKHAYEGDHERSQASENESGLGGLGALGAALASSLASNSHAQQGYPPPEAKSDVIGSILGALGGGGSHNQQSSSDPLGGALGSILGGLGGGSHSNHNQQSPSDPLGGALGSILGGLGGGSHANQQSPSDPLGGALGSILGGVLGGGGGHHQQPQYQPSGGYGGYPQGQDTQGGGGGGGGSDLLSGLGGALFKSALDGLSKNSHKPRYDDDPSGGHYSAPPPTAHYGGRYDDDYNSAPSRPPPRAPSPPAPGGGKLTAEEISKGLGLDD